jgi:site-specific recombinase XerD
MSLFLAFHDFLVYLRLHKGRSRKTQEQYAFHIWSCIVWIFSQFWNAEIAALRFSPRDFLPPLDKDCTKNWYSPLPSLSGTYPEPHIQSLTKKDFDTWRLSLADGWLSIKTVNAYIITLRSWLKYLKKEQIDCLDPTTLDLLKTEDREVTFLTQEEVMLFFANIVRDTIQWKRDYAIAMCIYSTGLRISELTALDRLDVNLDTLEFAVRGKWGKIRLVYLTPWARDAIVEYLSVRDDEFTPLFLRHNFSLENIDSIKYTNENLRLTRFFITNMIKSYWVRSGILKNLHAHTLRHSFATTLLTNW